MRSTAATKRGQAKRPISAAAAIRLATHDDLPLGAVLMVSFKLPGVDREVVARGRIVLSFYDAEAKRFFHGIAFTQISPQDQEEIIRWVGGRVHRLALENEAAD